MIVYAKIKDQLVEEVFKPDHEEEYEDSEGNVLNKKVLIIYIIYILWKYYYY